MNHNVNYSMSLSKKHLAEIDNIKDEAIDMSDDSWMKPYISEALANIKAGNIAPWSVDDLRAALYSRYPGLNNGADH